MQCNRLGFVVALLYLALPAARADIVVTNSGDQTILETTSTKVSFTVTNHDTYTVALFIASAGITVGPKDSGDWVAFADANGNLISFSNFTTCSFAGQVSPCNEVLALSLAPGAAHTFTYNLKTDTLSDIGPPKDTDNTITFAAVFDSSHNSAEETVPPFSTLHVFVSDIPEPSYLGLIGAGFLAWFARKARVFTKR